MNNKKRINYKKYYKLEFIILFLIFIGLYPLLSLKSLDMDSLKKNLDNIVDFNYLKPGDINDIKKLYYINQNYIEDFICYTPKSNVDAEEILILKAKNSENLSLLKDKVNSRLEKQSETFKTYIPENYSILKNAVLKTYGNYLVFIVSKNSSDINKLINSSFK